MMFKQSLVHLDLKGGAPKIDYLIEIIPLLKSSGATGILIEYEDTFPYTDTLSVLKNKNHYTELDLVRLFEACRSNQLTVVPLIQTLGHLEFLLKHDSFRDLREAKDYPNVICPTNKKSLPLICEILEQVIIFHKKHVNLEYIHLGADEVYFLGYCEKCVEKCKEKQWSKENLFLDHVLNLANLMKNNHSLTPIIWDDMLRTMDFNLIEKSDLNKNVQIMIWRYTELSHFSPQLTDENLWSKYLKLFDQFWIASAFKGASTVDACLPPIQFHVNNHLAWDYIIKNYVLTNPNYKQHVINIALTGWSRFDHMMTICELLPVSIPSLIICLLVVANMNSFTGEIHEKASQLLNFNTLIPMVLADLSQVSSSYPGFSLFNLSNRLIECINQKNALFQNPSLRGGFRKCLIESSRINPLHIRSFLNNAKTLQTQFSDLHKNFASEMLQFFREDTIKEFLELNVLPHLEKLDKLVKDCDDQLKEILE